MMPNCVCGHPLSDHTMERHNEIPTLCCTTPSCDCKLYIPSAAAVVAQPATVGDPQLAHLADRVRQLTAAWDKAQRHALEMQFERDRVRESLKEEMQRLEAENAELKEYQADAADRFAAVVRQRDAAEAENERLRAALTKLRGWVENWGEWHDRSASAWHLVIAEALEGGKK